MRQELYNLFRIERQEGEQWLITNLLLSTLEGDNEEEDTLLWHANSTPFKAPKQWWVKINDVCRAGDLIVGELSHHPYETFQLGIPLLSIKKWIKNDHPVAPVRVRLR